MPAKLLKVAPKKSLNAAFLKLRPICKFCCEAEIYRMEYDLYGLMEEERKIVEGE
jgi:hypothetical protein